MKKRVLPNCFFRSRSWKFGLTKNVNYEDKCDFTHEKKLYRESLENNINEI